MCTGTQPLNKTSGKDSSYSKHCRDSLWDGWHTFEMSENDSKSSQRFTSYSTGLGLMGSVGPRLLPCSWDLLCSALLCVLSSHSQNIGYPAYSAVIFFISDSLFSIFTLPHFSQCLILNVSLPTMPACHSFYWVAPTILFLVCKDKQFTLYCIISCPALHFIWVSTMK